MGSNGTEKGHENLWIVVASGTGFDGVVRFQEVELCVWHSGGGQSMNEHPEAGF